MNGADFSHLRMKNNIYRKVKTIINYPLLFNHCHVVNHLLKQLMFLIILGETNKPMMYKMLYYVYKTDKHMEEKTPKLNNTYIFIKLQ